MKRKIQLKSLNANTRNRQSLFVKFTLFESIYDIECILFACVVFCQVQKGEYCFVESRRMLRMIHNPQNYRLANIHIELSIHLLFLCRNKNIFPLYFSKQQYSLFQILNVDGLCSSRQFKFEKQQKHIQKKYFVLLQITSGNSRNSNCIQIDKHLIDPSKVCVASVHAI